MTNFSLRSAIVLFFLFISISSQSRSTCSSTAPLQGHEESAVVRTLEEEKGHAHEVHCSRERSRAARKIIEQYLIPFVEKEKHHIPKKCPLHPENDLYRLQEQSKAREDINLWRCGYCKKTFYEEKNLDKHLDEWHFDTLDTSPGRCLADSCGSLHCDLVMDSLRKTKCNPAAAARNKHACESLADRCFPVQDGPSARRLNDLFLRQFCDAHTCKGGRKPFSRGGKKKRNVLYIVASVLVLFLIFLFYLFLYLYERGMKRGGQGLKRITKSGQKKQS
ncbi:unnamed protein product [Linum tenue]|uniref:C2H2-type domain-containing protein n=1 Tax=Linum tenue TaxID=586396 RepID=A0AAV0NE49_9ROSI|nr:unnamed protein product [Linum tenue]